MTSRLLLGAVVLALIQATVMLIHRQSVPTAVQALQTDLATMPRRLGSWTGKDEPLEERLFRAIEALQVVNREYREDLSGSIVLQVAAFAGNETELSHPPQVCYTHAGWTAAEKKDVRLQVDKQTTRPARLLGFEREGQHVFVMYWYQYGDAHVLDFDGLRRERWKLVGQRTWPPLVKVMFQTTLTDPNRAERQLRDFGELVLDWSKQLH